MNDQSLPIRERLAHWVDHLSHVLPAQAPIRDFVHHNTLHGFQHLPFSEALAAAHHLTGAQCYWPESRFRACYEAGRITRDDLLTALDDAGVAGLDQPLVGGLTRREILLASLLEGDETPSTARLDWLIQEQAWADDPLFAVSRQCTVASGAKPVDWAETAQIRWDALCQRVGKDWTLRSLLEYLTGEDVLERVRRILQRQLAAHLDLGMAAWRNPAQKQGFFAAWRASAELDIFWDLDELPNVRDEIVHLGHSPLDVLVEELSRLIPDEDLWPGYLECLSLELPGWSGMFLWRGRNPEQQGVPVDMLDYLAVRVLLERMLCDDLMCRLSGAPISFEEFAGYFIANPAEFYVRDAMRRYALPEDVQQRVTSLTGELAVDRLGRDGAAAWLALAETVAACVVNIDADARACRLMQMARRLNWDVDFLSDLLPGEIVAVLDCAAGLSGLQRGQIWLLAYERHYREQLFSALTANHLHQRAVPAVSAQVVFCMDDREEGTRRHLEELAPGVLTYGAAGFFGVAMYWQGVDDAGPSALCPIVVTPKHLVKEIAARGRAEQISAHQRRRERRLNWRERLYQFPRRNPLSGPLVTALAGVPALLGLLGVSLAPAWYGGAAERIRRMLDGPVVTGLAVNADTANPDSTVQAGFLDSEQIDRVAAFLRSIGLTGDYAPLVLILGHGSGSENNPHRSAYDCGACSGRHGGPNARVFAAMANRPEVRAGLLARGLNIPDSTWFIAGEHNTCDDTIEWYDLSQVPTDFGPALDILVSQMSQACRAHAAERCRRFASAPSRLTDWQALSHVAGRASDISQARPELGHATNAAAFIGRRAMSRGLFLDRRVFLISYDPLADLAGAIVESILLAAGPVGAGIALEYYFSTVDNERLGCGSKITHNLTGLFGVMEGADSDLRTGLPLQMIEIHEPMRLLVVVEQTLGVLTEILDRQPPLQELINNGWIILAAKDPCTVALHQYCPRRGWMPWSGSAVLPQVATSADWFAGQCEPLPPAQILGRVAA